MENLEHLIAFAVGFFGMWIIISLGRVAVKRINERKLRVDAKKAEQMAAKKKDRVSKPKDSDLKAADMKKIAHGYQNSQIVKRKQDAIERAARKKALAEYRFVKSEIKKRASKGLYSYNHTSRLSDLAKQRLRDDGFAVREIDDMEGWISVVEWE